MKRIPSFCWNCESKVKTAEVEEFVDNKTYGAVNYHIECSVCGQLMVSSIGNWAEAAECYEVCVGKPYSRVVFNKLRKKLYYIGA